ncbi:zinc finger protein 28-like [Cydia strobilella]|uniref:zinc finger protein 28-like n=1 Tax=Cydia strobilella TaxID=1100964 RepID=UPI003004046F
MEASAGGGMARVKQEWQEPAWAGGLVVKEEAECVDEEECVKEECSDSRDGCGMSEAAMLAGLYDEHVVKDELVLGPERPHRPTVALVVRSRALGDAGGGGGGGAQRARDCSVRLERLASHAGAARDHRPRGTAPSDTATPPHTDSGNEQEIFNKPDYDKEPTCDLCGERFDLKSDLIKHVAVHIHVPISADLGAGRPGVSGNAPAVVSGRRRSCAVRLERVLLDAARRSCRVGRRTYKLHTHTHTAEPAHTRNLTITTASYQCHHCGKRFGNKSVLVKHIRTHLPLGASSNSTRENDALEHQQSQQTLHKDKKYFVTVLRKPEMTHRGAKPFKCRYCDYTSCNNVLIRRHEMIHTGEKPFKCNYCDYKCRQKENLRTHEMIHTGEKPFKCKNCDYKCKQKAHLRVHEMIHTGEKRFKCNYCDYKCNQKGSLQFHEMIHTGENPFKCNYCDYKCNRKGSLRRHERIHTGEKPFKCNYCDYKCRHKENLWTHEMIHTGEKPFKCNYCDYKCRQKENLRTHEMIHTVIIRSPRVALCGMEASAGGGMARVKQEWQEPAWAGDHVVKEEAEFVDEEECVKEECSDSRDGCGMSEAAMLAGLYDEHVVKDELVLGPERPHRPTVALVVSNRALGDVDGGFAAGGGGGGGAQRARDCSVRLERLASHAGAARDHRPRGTAPSDTATPPHTDSGNEQEIYRPNYDKEPVCDLCGERFDLKSDLIKHAAVHIHVPTSAELGAGRPGVSGNGEM